MANTSTALAQLVIIDPQTTPRVFWKGAELSEVNGFLVHYDGPRTSVKLRLANTNPQNSPVYVEMIEAGISLSKEF